MTKKKGVSRIVTGALGIGVLIAVIIPVMFFVFGVGNAEVLPQNTDPEPFEIPITCNEGEIKTPEGTCVPDVIPIIEEPELFCTTDQAILQKIAECQILTGDERFVNVPIDELGTSQEECSSFQTEDAIECSLEIDAILEDLYENLVLPDPPEPNGTETSIDDPFTQICDQDPTLIICGDSRSLEVITRVLKTDSAGTQTVVETFVELPFAQLFVEDSSNIDFRTGQLQFEVQVKGDRDFRYMGTGKVDLLIGEQSLFLTPLNVKVDGITDEEGKVDLLFISPTGATSDLLLFDFEDNFDKFINELTSTVRLNVIELNVAGERDQDFTMVDQDLFTLDIFRDDIQILITDTEGIESRVYPSDSRLNINAKTSISEEVLVGATRTRIFTSDFLGNGVGCTQHYLSSDTTTTPSTSVRLTVPAPTLTGITVMDSEGNVIDTGTASPNYSLQTLTRNENYTVKIISPSITSSDLDYGKSQETKTFTCTQKGTPLIQQTSIISGSTAPCQTQVQRFYTVATQIDPASLGDITCNIPTETP